MSDPNKGARAPGSDNEGTQTGDDDPIDGLARRVLSSTWGKAAAAVAVVSAIGGVYAGVAAVIDVGDRALDLGGQALNGFTPSGDSPADNATTGSLGGARLRLSTGLRQSVGEPFQSSLEAQPGASIQGVVKLENISEQAATAVVLRAAIPKHAALVSGSVRLVDSRNPAARVIGDGFTNGGLRYETFAPGEFAKVYYQLVADQQLPRLPWFFKTFGLVTSDQTDGSEFYDSARVDFPVPN